MNTAIVRLILEFPKKRGINLCLVAFFAAFVVGCGSSGNDFVSNPGATSSSNTGTLVFNFTPVSPQAVEVPNTTTNLDFDFFDAGNSKVYSATQPFATTVTITGVPLTATRVTITARGANGTLATIDAPVSVVADGSVVVNLSGATVTRIGQLMVEPASLRFAPGGLLGAVDDLAGLLTNGDINNIAMFRAYFTPPGSTEPVEVTSRVGVTFSNFFPSTLTANSFAYLNLFGEGIAITANPLAPTPPFGATATMTVTYIENGQAYTDNVEIVLDNPVLTGVDVQSLTLPDNGVGNFPVAAFATYSNGLRLPILFDSSNNGSALLPGFTDTFVLSVQTPATGLALASNGTLVTTGGGAGQTAVLRITANGSASTNFNVSLIGGQVSEVALRVPRTDVNPSGSYKVILTYNDAAGSTQDVTRVWGDIDIIPGPGDALLFTPLEAFPNGRILGSVEGAASIVLADGSTANVTNDLNGLGLPGSDSNATNNSVDLNILSRVPLTSLGGALPFPLPLP